MPRLAEEESMSSNTCPSPYALLRDLFWAAATTCFLWALHRLAAGSLLRARLSAYDKLGDEFLPEELEALVHVIKHDALSY